MTQDKVQEIYGVRNGETEEEAKKRFEAEKAKAEREEGFKSKDEPKKKGK